MIHDCGVQTASMIANRFCKLPTFSRLFDGAFKCYATAWTEHIQREEKVARRRTMIKEFYALIAYTLLSIAAKNIHRE